VTVASPTTPDGADANLTPGDATAEIAAKAGRGLSWSLIGTVAVKLGNFAVSIVIARLLLPSDYGVYAVALAALHFVMHVNDVGIIAATVQWRGRIEDMAATASAMALAFSVAVFAAFWFLAEPFARLAGVPQAAGVVRVVTIAILIDGATAVRAGVIMREFRQDKLIKANAAGFVVGAAVTIGLAASMGGPYSFAWGNIAGAVVTGVLVMVWGRVPLRYGLDRAIARRLLVFGLPLAAGLGVEAVVLNADYVVVGHVLGATVLGFYLMAFNISSWIPTIVTTAVRYVSVAGFSRLAEKDSAQLSAGVERTIPLLLTGLVPAAVLLSTLARPLIEVVFGAQWLPSAGVLSVLMVLTAIKMLTDFAADILIGAGATRATLWINLCWALTLVPALVLGAHWGGAVGTAVAHVIIGLAIALPLTGFALHRAGVRLRAVGRRSVRPLLGGVLTVPVCLLLGQVPGPAAVPLVVAGLAGLGVYLTTGVAATDRRFALDKLRPLAARLARPRRSDAEASA
jgi:PST family polysaccharide transporter